MLSRSSKERAQKLDEWRKKHGRSKFGSTKKLKTTGSRYQLRTRSVRPSYNTQSTSTPRKRSRKENDDGANKTPSSRSQRSKIPTPAKRTRRDLTQRRSLGTKAENTVIEAARGAFKMTEAEITALLRTRCREKKWELKKTVTTQKDIIKKLKKSLKGIFDEKKAFIETCTGIETHLSQHCDQLKLRTNKAEKDRVSLQLKLGELLQDQGIKAKQIARLEEARAKSVHVADELTQQLTILQKDLQTLKAQEAEHVTHIQKVEGNLKAATEQLTALETEFADQKAKYLTSLQDTENRLRTELEAAKTAAKEVQQDLKEQLNHETQQKQVSLERAQVLAQKVATLEGDCKAKEMDLTTLRMQVNHCNESVDRMKRDCDSTKAQLKAKEDQLAGALSSFSQNQDSHQKRVDQMMEMRSSLENNIRNQQNSKERLDTEIHTLQQSLSVSETKLADTQLRLSENESQLSKKTVELATTQQSLESTKETLSNTVSQLKETKAAFEHSTVQWKQQTESDKQAWEVAKDHLEEMLRTRSTTLDDTKSKLDDTQKKLEASESAKSEFQVVLREKQIEVDTIKANMGVSYETQMAKLVEMASERESLNRRLNTHGMLQSSYEDLLRKTREMERQLLENEIVRRKLHNRIQELRGNIRVFVRVRPFLPSDGIEDVFMQPIKFSPDEQSLKVVPASDAPAQRFKFDKTFGMKSKQVEVFEEVSELVQSALDGHNVCIFSYGQTGSGKTYTMQGVGSGEQEGLIPRSIKQILTAARKLRAQGWEFYMDASFLEIYNEKINDLLSTFEGATCPDGSKTNRAGYDVKKNHKGETYVSNLKCFRVNEMHEVERLISHATKTRSVGCTAMNSQSSRSHSVFTLQVTGINKLETKKLRGSLHLCDLAGSERLARSHATGKALKETQNINKSLSFLTNVFMQIKAKNSHISFRDSKLTYLLESCFSKNGKTMMLVNVSPTPESTQETLCSLKFATNVNQVELGKAKAKVERIGTPKKGKKTSTTRTPKGKAINPITRIKRGAKKQNVSRTRKRVKR